MVDGYVICVQTFDTGGDFLRKWGVRFYNDRIHKFTAGRDYLTAFDSEPENPGVFLVVIA